MESPFVDIIGHPTGRLVLRREPYRLNVERILDAAARTGIALEINCHADRLDLSDVHAALARERGVKLMISSDAHSKTAFGDLLWGVLVARRAWLEPSHVLNTLPLDRFRAALRRNR
jgi:DNA polymerase (family 10)